MSTPPTYHQNTPHTQQPSPSLQLSLQATLIIEQPAEYEDLEAMQRAQLNSAIAAEFLAARQEALCKRVLVAWREHTQQAALVAALLREVALLREEKVLRGEGREHGRSATLSSGIQATRGS